MSTMSTSCSARTSENAWTMPEWFLPMTVTTVSRRSGHRGFGVFQQRQQIRHDGGDGLLPGGLGEVPEQDLGHGDGQGSAVRWAPPEVRITEGACTRKDDVESQFSFTGPIPQALCAR